MKSSGNPVVAFLAAPQIELPLVVSHFCHIKDVRIVAQRLHPDLHQFLVGRLYRNNPVSLDLVRQNRLRMLLNHHNTHTGSRTQKLLTDNRVGEGCFA
ncbi:hypothetical protein D3C73_1480370 [compost metagenome]